jgi:hypothetical protein
VPQIARLISVFTADTKGLERGFAAAHLKVESFAKTVKALKPTPLTTRYERRKAKREAK